MTDRDLRDGGAAAHDRQAGNRVANFSKIHGMAGMRVGYAVGHPDALALVRREDELGHDLERQRRPGLASLGDTAHLAKQRELNDEARAFTRKAFERAGYTGLPSEANFVMVDVRARGLPCSRSCAGRLASQSRARSAVDEHARITIGTVDEMKRACR